MKEICGAELVYLGSTISLQMAEGMDDETLAVYAALYTTIGDQLALILTLRV